MTFFSRYLLQPCLTVWLSLSPFVVAAEEVEVTAEVAKLLAPDRDTNDSFGNSVSLDGDRLAIGAFQDVDNGVQSGSVYVFERDAEGSWIPATKLVPLDGRNDDSFGSSVSLDGDRLAIGATGDGTTGSVYLFERDADGSWFQASKLLVVDWLVDSSFGVSVSLDGDRLAIGAHTDDDNGTASGSAYLFERNVDGSWSQAGKLLAADGDPFDQFGFSVSLDGDRVAIGADKDDDNGPRSGSAYLFERGADGSWSQVRKLLALDGQQFDSFGRSVSLDGDRVAIGAYDDDDNGTASGSAYLFERNVDGSWSQVRKLVALDGQEGDLFGWSLSLDRDRLAIGAHGDSDADGSAYLFERNASGKWFQASKVLALDGQGGRAFFGEAVTLDGGRLAIGALNYVDNKNINTGAVYLFEPVLVSPRLSVAGTCPGELVLTSTGATPRSRIGVYGSPNQGTWEIDGGSCAGTVLGLEAPTQLRQNNTDFNAEGTLVRTVDASWCGTYLQLLDERTCLASEVVQVP